MTTFIVRIYRAQDDAPDNIIGVVEEAGGQRGGEIFYNREELWALMDPSTSVGGNLNDGVRGTKDE